MATKEGRTGYKEFMQCSAFDGSDCGSVRMESHAGLYEIRYEIVRHGKFQVLTHATSDRGEAIQRYEEWKAELFKRFESLCAGAIQT